MVVERSFPQLEIGFGFERIYLEAEFLNPFEHLQRIHVLPLNDLGLKHGYFKQFLVDIAVRVQMRWQLSDGF